MLFAMLREGSYGPVLNNIKMKTASIPREFPKKNNKKLNYRWTKIRNWSFLTLCGWEWIGTRSAWRDTAPTPPWRGSVCPSFLWRFARWLWRRSPPFSRGARDTWWPRSSTPQRPSGSESKEWNPAEASSSIKGVISHSKMTREKCVTFTFVLGAEYGLDRVMTLVSLCRYMTIPVSWLNEIQPGGKNAKLFLSPLLTMTFCKRTSINKLI